MSNETHIADCGCQEYNELSRRQFLGAAAAGTAASMFPAWLPKIVLGKTYASNRDMIVSIFLRGGADGLAIVAPYADPAYYTSRPTIGIPRPDANDANKGIDLDGFFAFAAGMSGLVPAYTAQDLLVVHATGLQTNNTRSHFDAQRYMEVGKPADPNLITGWLGRHLASVPPLKAGALLRGIGVSNGLQKTLVGAPQTLPIADPANFTIGGSADDAATAVGVHAERVRRGRRAAALGRARRREYGDADQVGELHRLQAGEQRDVSDERRSVARCAHSPC